MQGRSLAARQPIRVRFDQLKRSPGLNVIGIPELVGLAGAALIALITIFAYFYFLVPAHSRLTSAQLERDRLQGQLRASQTNFDKDASTKTNVDKINASLEDFESNWLAAAAAGRMSLYKELNTLIRSNGLRNTAGPTYSPLEPVGSKNLVQPTASASQQSNAKWQTIYPGIAVTVTVEGLYQNVRHFVRDVETSREFLIINAVELESVTQSGASQELPVARNAPSASGGGAAAPPVTQTPGTRATLVSLRLDMATYFQRPGIEGASTP